MDEEVRNSNELNLSPPWCEYYNELEELFKEDPDIKIVFNENTDEIKLYVTGSEKADALTQLLPSEKYFGNVCIKIIVIPANPTNEMSPFELIQAAFKNNPIVSYFHSVDNPYAMQMDFVVFRNQVVQYYNDNLGDINGMRSTLYQDIAKEIFENIPVHFCTDVANVGKPLGEWP